MCRSVAPTFRVGNRFCAANEFTINRREASGLLGTLWDKKATLSEVR
jgi:hypothetical protein